MAKNYRKMFFRQYDDQWDFTHQNLNRGMLYLFFLKKNGLTMNSAFPIHLKDVPSEYRDGYLQYLKESLADHWGVSISELEETYTLESAIREFSESI